MNSLTVLFIASFALAAQAFPGPHIVGGKDAPEGKHPYAVSLQVNKRHFCGGSIIGKRYVVTAAHCIVNRAASTITVNVGSNYWKAPKAVYGVEKAIVHPKYDRFLKQNDVGLIRVSSDIKFSETVKPILISDIYYVPAGQPAVAAGWGRLSAGGQVPNALQEVELNVYDQQKCNDSYMRIIKSHICTYTKVGLGVCNGDSGGPLVSNGELIGIVSFGRPCAIGHPDVYTRAYSFRDWLTSNMVE